MKHAIRIALATALVAASTFAAKSYQVTGPVLEVSPTAIVVQKGKEKWEISRDATQGADVKVGDKVTVEYTMAAKSIETKGAPTASDTAKSKAKGKKK